MRKGEIQQESGGTLVVVNMGIMNSTKSSITAASADVNLLHKMHQDVLPGWKEGRKCRVGKSDEEQVE